MKDEGQTNVAKEKIIEWDPEILFLDLSTLQMGDKAGGLFELKTDPAYRTLGAVQRGQVYGVLPYNWYAQNFGSILTDAYFIGKLLYPHRFGDINPEAKADEIYTFLVGKPVFKEMDRMFQGMVFKKISVK
jgi:iron complex transport system substrate-binding protein